MKLNMMIDLDSIYDTRLTTLLTDFGTVAWSFDETFYNKRDRNSFGLVNEKIFKYAYSKRNIDTLLASQKTQVFRKIKDDILLFNDSLSEEQTVLKDADITFHLNIWPYKLDDEDIEYFVLDFAKNFSAFHNIRIIDEAIPDLDEMKDKIQYYYKYNGTEYLHLNLLLTGNKMGDDGLKHLKTNSNTKIVTPLLLDIIADENKIEKSQKLLMAAYETLFNVEIVEPSVFNYQKEKK